MPPYKENGHNGPGSLCEPQKTTSKVSKRKRPTIPINKPSKFGGKAQNLVYLRKPENDWQTDDKSQDDLLDVDPSKNEMQRKGEKIKKNSIGHLVKALGEIPSFTYNQKMTNWFTLNKLAEGKRNDNKEPDKGSEMGKVRITRAGDTIKEQGQGHRCRPIVKEPDKPRRNVHLKLFETRGRRCHPPSKASTPSQEVRRSKEPKKEAQLNIFSEFADEREREEREMKYLHLLEGWEAMVDDFETTKQEMRIMNETPGKDDLPQIRWSWDSVIRKRILEKLEAGRKEYADLNARKELLEKMSATPVVDLQRKPHDYTVAELKCLLDLQSKEPAPKLTVAQFRKVLNTLGYTRNVLNFDELLNKLDTEELKKFGYGVGNKKLKDYLLKEADRLKLKKKAKKIPKNIGDADKRIAEFLKDEKRPIGCNVPRRPLLLLFPPTYIIGNYTGLDPISKAYYPPRTYREMKRIREADEFWKHHGKDDMCTNARWDKYRLNLHWRYHQNAMEGPGFPTQSDRERHPYVFGHPDEAPAKVSPFATPNLIAAVNLIINHSALLAEEKKKKDLEKPKFFHREKGNITPHAKKCFSRKRICGLQQCTQVPT